MNNPVHYFHYPSTFTRKFPQPSDCALKLKKKKSLIFPSHNPSILHECRANKGPRRCVCVCVCVCVIVGAIWVTKARTKLLMAATVHCELVCIDHNCQHVLGIIYSGAFSLTFTAEIHPCKASISKDITTTLLPITTWIGNKEGKTYWPVRFCVFNLINFILF